MDQRSLIIQFLLAGFMQINMIQALSEACGEAVSGTEALCKLSGSQHAACQHAKAVLSEKCPPSVPSQRCQKASRSREGVWSRCGPALPGESRAESSILAGAMSLLQERAEETSLLQERAEETFGITSSDMGGTLTKLDMWSTNTPAWSDRGDYKFSSLGSFTPANYDYFMQSSVTDRTDNYNFKVVGAATVVVLSHVAGYGGGTAPTLSGWSTCSGLTLPYFKCQGSTYELDNCRTKTFTDGGTISVTSLGAKTATFISYDVSDTEGPCFQPSNFGLSWQNSSTWCDNQVPLNLDSYNIHDSNRNGATWPSSTMEYGAKRVKTESQYDASVADVDVWFTWQAGVLRTGPYTHAGHTYYTYACGCKQSKITMKRRAQEYTATTTSLGTSEYMTCPETNSGDTYGRTLSNSVYIGPDILGANWCPVNMPWPQRSVIVGGLNGFYLYVSSGWVPTCDKMPWGLALF